MAHILIADDDPQIREILRIAFEKQGYVIEAVADGASALAAAETGAHDLLVLDIGMPEMDGLDVCRELRKSSQLPILFLTARDDEIDRVIGLEIGGDDYVAKPFSPRELVARVKAILKRSGERAVKRGLSRGALTLDPDRHRCEVKGTPLTLTAREMEIMAHLMARPEHVVSRPQLVDTVYGNNVNVSDRTIDSHIRNLRGKLADAGLPDAIETVHGVGVRMGPCRGG